MSLILETPSLGANPPLPAAHNASLSVGLALQPAFADHAVHGAVILPGAFYLTAALRAGGLAGGQSSLALRAINFSRPVILAPAPVTLSVELQPAGADLRCTFREGAESACASFVLESGEARLPRRLSLADIENSLELAGEDGLSRPEFYEQLRRRGNHYGPCFQSVARVARAGDSAIARFDLAQAAMSSIEEVGVIAADAAVQALMIFGLSWHRAMVLRSIASVTIRSDAAPRGGWIVVTRAASSTAEAVVGDAVLYDAAGVCWLELRGVTLTLIDAEAAQATPPVAPLAVQLAASFTAEPIADVIRFWSDKCGLPLRPDFAPYGQVFQQLLSPTSPFRRNREGWNVVLINLADWHRERTALPATGAPSRAPSFPAGLARHTLPNGLEIAHLNRHETEYVYREIFEDRCYLRHGIRLPASGTVVDIGANIGLFTLFIRQEAPGARVIACEPNPAAFRALQANCEAYGSGLLPLNVGVSEKRGSALFTSYEKSSVFSTFHAHPEEDAHAIRAIAHNVARRHAGDSSGVEQAVDELLADRLQAETLVCPLVSVSDLIIEHQLKQVDLLKIDAEKCELEILRGIDVAHWPLIRQVVIEVHDRSRQKVAEVERLLAARGFHCTVVEEELLHGSGLFNVYATREGAPGDSLASAASFLASVSALRRTAGELVDALAVQAHATPAQTLLVVAPTDPASVDAVVLSALFEVERDLLRRVTQIPRVVALGSDEILRYYPAQRFFQAEAPQLGHIPYTADGFAALGTCIVRKIAATRRPPFKVLVLDCDHTLWAGACAEDGAGGVTIGPAQRALQEFALRQRAEGMLLCLCSKNQETDVWAVFAENPGMLLRREHFAAVRINWEPKSANLRALAAELNVGLESLVLLDDNPLERAEVAAQCPQVCVPGWPAKASALPQFLAHCWLFDRPRTTTEDRSRSRMVEENRLRETYREQAPSLASFLAGLELQVAIAAPDRGALPRVAQLTQRTNQFNLSPRPCSEAELAEYLADHTHRCLAVRVSDRFGDYGTVGAMLYTVEADCLRVEAFLLSCRALGRGVEHQMLAALAREASAAKKTWLELVLRPTARNRPAWDFLASVGLAPDGSATSVRLAAEACSNLKYEPRLDGPVADDEPAPARAATGADAPLAGQSSSALFAEIATVFDDPSKIAAAAEAHRLAGLGFSGASRFSAEPPDSLRGKLLQIWRRTLGNPRIGIDDRFMEVGGTSLGAVQIVAAVRQQLNLPLSVVVFFECPTVRLLSERLSATETSSGAADEALARGARRARRHPGRASPPAERVTP